MNEEHRYKARTACNRQKQRSLGYTKVEFLNNLNGSGLLRDIFITKISDLLAFIKLPALNKKKILKIPIIGHYNPLFKITI